MSSSSILLTVLLQVHTDLYLHIISQRRLKSIVKAAGFDLVNGQIVGPDGSIGGGDAVVTPAKKARAKRSPAKKAANGETPAKKRKLSDSVVDSASDEEGDKQVKEEEAQVGSETEVEHNGENSTSGEN